MSETEAKPKKPSQSFPPFVYFIDIFGYWIHVFFPTTGKSYKLQVDCMGSIARAPSTSLGDSIYFIGASLPCKTYSISVADPSNSTSRQLVGWTSIPYWRRDLALIPYRHSIYVIGGTEEIDLCEYWINRCERYDPLRDEWTNLPPLNGANLYPCGCAMDGFIYVAARFFSGNMVEIERLDTLDEAAGWQILKPDLLEMESNLRGGIFQAGNRDLILFDRALMNEELIYHKISIEPNDIPKARKVRAANVEHAKFKYMNQDMALVGGRMYTIDGDGTLMYDYDLKTQLWRMTKLCVDA